MATIYELQASHWPAMRILGLVEGVWKLVDRVNNRQISKHSTLAMSNPRPPQLKDGTRYMAASQGWHQGRHMPKLEIKTAHPAFNPGPYAWMWDHVIIWVGSSNPTEANKIIWGFQTHFTALLPVQLGLYL